MFAEKPGRENRQLIKEQNKRQTQTRSREEDANQFSENKITEIPAQQFGARTLHKTQLELDLLTTQQGMDNTITTSGLLRCNTRSHRNLETATLQLYR
jgi:hypothetical protein